MKDIRNFSVIAHIDHGKSTFSDRIIETCNGNFEANQDYQSQILDSMVLERERGITIKAQNVTLQYKSKTGKRYYFNLIDTPGHVDFSYEVSRSLSACEGVLLLVDSSQGVEAQTIAHCNMALDMKLPIIPILNKVDLPLSDPNRVIKEINELIPEKYLNKIMLCSSKTGFGIINIIEYLIKKIPSPHDFSFHPLKALIIDSWFDQYFGIVSLIRIKEGIIKIGDQIKIMSSNRSYKVEQLGIFTPKKIIKTKLTCGEIGWLICSMKDIKCALVGDTITTVNNPAIQSLPGFKRIIPKVYAGFFSSKTENYTFFRDALMKLSLNDSSFFYEPEQSNILGFGFRCGFLGLLHMEIVQERLKREYNLELIITTPTVMYQVRLKNNSILYLDNPSKLPEMNKIKEFREPIAKCMIVIPNEKYLGKIITLCSNKRGKQSNILYYGSQIELIYEIPMIEIMIDFFNCLKSVSKGYASLDYNLIGYKKSDIICLDILINSKKIDPLSLIIHRSNSLYHAKSLVSKIKSLIPSHQFEIVIQAAIGKKIIARSTIKQFRKNVIAKCYGGDVSRKKKLLEKQRYGKKKMKKIGNVSLPIEIFRSIFFIDKK
ncbi:MAG: translation elongation factor 4 [Arsenophonus sp.]|nr:MAG: translation elongation factor 4 [Arsenophonus sp.]